MSHGNITHAPICNYAPMHLHAYACWFVRGLFTRAGVKPYNDAIWCIVSRMSIVEHAMIYQMYKVHTYNDELVYLAAISEPTYRPELIPFLDRDTIRLCNLPACIHPDQYAAVAKKVSCDEVYKWIVNAIDEGYHGPALWYVSSHAVMIDTWYMMMIWAAKKDSRAAIQWIHKASNGKCTLAGYKPGLSTIALMKSLGYMIDPIHDAVLCGSSDIDKEDAVQYACEIGKYMDLIAQRYEFDEIVYRSRVTNWHNRALEWVWDRDPKAWIGICKWFTWKNIVWILPRLDICGRALLLANSYAALNYFKIQPFEYNKNKFAMMAQPDVLAWMRKRECKHG